MTKVDIFNFLNTNKDELRDKFTLIKIGKHSLIFVCNNIYAYSSSKIHNVITAIYGIELIISKTLSGVIFFRQS